MNEDDGAHRKGGSTRAGEYAADALAHVRVRSSRLFRLLGSNARHCERETRRGSGVSPPSWWGIAEEIEHVGCRCIHQWPSALTSGTIAESADMVMSPIKFPHLRPAGECIFVFQKKKVHS